MRARVLVMFLVVGMLVPVAFADNTVYDGNELLRDIERPQGNPDRMFALGMVFGVAVEGDLLGALCTPDGSNAGQYLRVVEKYLRDNPDKLHWEAHALIHNAINKHWRCKEEK